jgi:hypothetical protein
MIVMNVTPIRLFLNSNKKQCAILSYVAFFALLILFSFPRQSNAQWVPVQDTKVGIATSKGAATGAVTTANTAKNLVESTKQTIDSSAMHLKEFVLDGIINMVVSTLLRNITDSIVNWINSGFEGSPSFIENPESFFMDVADQTIGQLIESMGPIGEFVCSPFYFNLRFSLGLHYSTSRKTVVNCRLSDVQRNIQNAFTKGSFGGSGGWQNFIDMSSTPSNNPYGSYVEATSMIDASIVGKTNIQLTQLNWGRGFMSWQDCVKYAPDTVTYDVSATSPSGEGKEVRTNGACIEKGPIKTPGSVIEGQLNASLPASLQKLGLADEINEILGALVGQMINQVFSATGLAGAGKSGGNKNSVAQITADAQKQINASNQGLGGGVPAGMDCNTQYVVLPLSSGVSDGMGGMKPARGTDGQIIYKVYPIDPKTGEEDLKKPQLFSTTEYYDALNSGCLDQALSVTSNNEKELASSTLKTYRDTNYKEPETQLKRDQAEISSIPSSGGGIETGSSATVQISEKKYLTLTNASLTGTYYDHSDRGNLRYYGSYLLIDGVTYTGTLIDGTGIPLTLGANIYYPKTSIAKGGPTSLGQDFIDYDYKMETNQPTTIWHPYFEIVSPSKNSNSPFKRDYGTNQVTTNVHLKNVSILLRDGSTIKTVTGDFTLQNTVIVGGETRGGISTNCTVHSDTINTNDLTVSGATMFVPRLTSIQIYGSTAVTAFDPTGGSISKATIPILEDTTAGSLSNDMSIFSSSIAGGIIDPGTFNGKCVTAGGTTYGGRVETNIAYLWTLGRKVGALPSLAKIAMIKEVLAVTSITDSKGNLESLEDAFAVLQNSIVVQVPLNGSITPATSSGYVTTGGEVTGGILHDGATQGSGEIPSTAPGAIEYHHDLTGALIKKICNSNADRFGTCADTVK